MATSRRSFLTSAAAAIAAPAVGSSGPLTTARPAAPHHRRRCARKITEHPRYDPVIEVDRSALQHNVTEVSRLCGGRPILAVVKNNAYGLGLSTVGPILDSFHEIVGLAVVKPDQAIALRDAGVRKPILLMGLFSDTDAEELVMRDIQLAPYSDGDDRRLAQLARTVGRPIHVHLYLDTGMGRLGMSFRRATPWIEALANQDGIRVEGTFTCFTEEDSFDPEQLRRFLAVVRDARGRGLDLGRLHAASSHGLFFRRDAYLDMLRPGLVVYGAYPSGARDMGLADLRPAFRLRARVVRVERLEAGDSVSYGRNYIAERPTWVATLPVGHADGYPRAAVNGCEVLIGARLYRVIGAVSASHAIVELGDDLRVSVGDEATLIGPDDPAVHPNAVAERAGISVYDVLMHLSARLPKFVTAR